MVLYSPFIHHMAMPPWESRKPNAYACGSKCIDAAIQAVRIAYALEAQGMFNEAYALTVDVLAIAATTLLAVESRAPANVSAEVLRKCSRDARTLMVGLALQNNAAARCFESLTVLLNSIARRETFKADMLPSLYMRMSRMLQPSQRPPLAIQTCRI
jgi:hypothetical protein